MDWSQDLVLRALQNLDEPIGSLIKAYPGRLGLARDPDWLEPWFVDLTRRIAAGNGPDAKTIVASAGKRGDLALLAKPPVTASVRLLSIRPRYFRGFRDILAPIRFDEDLVVVEGRNSSGKTSLSEAIEWALTGELSRRSSGEHGHATELADCIGNEFRPAGERTTVELTLSVDGNRTHLRRVLVQDYSTTASGKPASQLLVDEQLLTEGQEHELRERLLAGVHPILMQHNLRRFVHDDPTSRRIYFERLLQIDELTGLIEKAVLGPQRLEKLSAPGGGVGLAALRSLLSELEKISDSPAVACARGLRKLEREPGNMTLGGVTDLLVSMARACFSLEVGEARELGECRERLASAQHQERATRLPLLGGFEAARLQPEPSAISIVEAVDRFEAASQKLGLVQAEASAISTAQQDIARAAERLLEIGAITRNPTGAQPCPLCEQSDSLQPTRVQQLLSWIPLASILAKSHAEVQSAQRTMGERLEHLRRSIAAAIPRGIDENVVEEQLKGSTERIAELTRRMLDAVRQVREAETAIHSSLGALEDAARHSVKAVGTLRHALKGLHEAVDAFSSRLQRQRHQVEQVREAVGAVSRDDVLYRLRERWLELAAATSSLIDDAAWEQAKSRAKGFLDDTRNGLIALRGRIIEDSRNTFSEEMTRLWDTLRSDTGAKFSGLMVPAARGRGYKLELELKAVISDGSKSSEVDALRVFSESQVNVVGIAAYVTRAKFLGHKLLIFDDPVQSMDEEHFRSFAATLLPMLIDDGFQVIVLTHNDGFARRIHDHHYARDSYATLETRSSRRKGCCVDEGNRRVSARLKKARRLAEDGDLAGAWRVVRIAIERMYILAMARESPDFDPESWQNLTADDMWNKGVGAIISKRASGSARRLKEILDATAAGAHDKPAVSETELVRAVEELAALLRPLRLGSG